MMKNWIRALWLALRITDWRCYISYMPVGEVIIDFRTAWEVGKIVWLK